MPKQAALYPISSSQPLDRHAIKHIRSAIEAHLDAANQLIAILDDQDADPDLEDDGCHDEPSLGSSESRNGGTEWAHLGQGIGFDCEIDAGDCGESDHEGEAALQPAMLDGLKLTERDESVRHPPTYICASPLVFRKPLRSARR